MLTVIAGVNWGDEGKGRMVDYLAAHYDVIVRYQGGNNAGHTIINDMGKFVLNLVPSGIFGDTVNVLGAGMVIDLEHLHNEIKGLCDRGVRVSPDNLVVSDKAVICMPVHRMQDAVEEDRLGDKMQGSTRRGIGPVYADKLMRKALRTGDLFNRETLARKVHDFAAYKRLHVEGGYGAAMDSADEMLNWLERHGAFLRDYIKDAGDFLTVSAKAGKNILFEAQLGALRDIDYGIYPYTTSSTTLAAYAPIGAGVPAMGTDKVIGVIKAFSSCVGEGPFVVEMHGAQGEALRTAGAEFGAATGRPRRVGGFDLVASAYGVALQGADVLALTKLDVLRGMEQIPVCVAYEIDGRRVERFLSVDDLNRAKPVFEYFEGFTEDITGIKKFNELPIAAQRYVKFIESALNCPIGYVSVGAKRDEIIVIGE